MNNENEKAKVRLRAELEDLDQRRVALETELEAIETETTPKIYKRANWEILSPSQQSAICAAVRRGEALLID